jgi:hypothetical protein
VALYLDAGWSPDQRLCAVRLLGKEPADAVDDPMVQTIYLCAFVLGSKDAQVFGDQSVEMIRREFEYFLERWKGRRIPAAMPPGREAARDGLRALVDCQIAALEARSAGHAEWAAAEAAAGFSACGGSAQEDRLRRLQGRIFNAFLRAVNLLMEVRSRPASPFPAPDAAASRGEPNDCGNLRNEPNGDPRPTDPTRVGLTSQPDSVGPDPRKSGPQPDSVPSNPRQAESLTYVRSNVRLEGPSFRNGPAPAVDLATTALVVTHCEAIRNEPTEADQCPEPVRPKPIFMGPSQPAQVLMTGHPDARGARMRDLTDCSKQMHLAERDAGIIK